MALITHERFNIGPNWTHRLVGSHVFHKESYPPMLDRDIYMCGISEGQDIFEVERIDTPWHVLVFCLSGQGEVFTPDGMTRPFRAGQLALMPYCVHSGYRRTGIEAMDHIWFLIGLSGTRWEFLKKPEPSIQASTEGAALFDAVQQFHREAQRFHAGDPQNLVVPALDFLSAALERAVKPLQSTLGWAEQLQQLFLYVQQHLDQDWDNAALAAQLHITTTHLHRLCTQHLQETPNKIVFRMKMNHAKELLLHGYSVGEVARICGYQEVASFSRRFNQYFGYNPSQALSKYKESGLNK